MILYDYPASPNSRKVRIVLAEKGIEYEKRTIDISKGEQRSTAYLAVNPHGKVPALQDARPGPDGKPRTIIVYDSTIINEYLEETCPDPPLFPTDPAERAMARILEDWADTRLIEPVGVLFGQNVFTAETRRNTARISEARIHTIDLLRRLEKILADGRAYLLGDYTIADAAITPSLAYAVQFGTPVHEALPKVAQWYLRLKNRPSFSA